ncbi:hypothetical protein PROFUN_13839 [Planoprotostelium fungivorum]|uniref:Phosphoglycerate mutase family protein n=1 Tax=Planoprotostelium fungivorum TaxID=1890364 RepID=A0A2P6N2Y2_9EUKA|nr:hypothetical protein PROFUN_13839 [Planoprotostelium fungivorum]
MARAKPTDLKCKWFGLRHAESNANRQGIIISDPKSGATQEGVRQAKESAERWCQSIRELQRPDRLLILTSDFSRASQTADVFRKTIMEQQPTLFSQIDYEVTPILRERVFGDLEGKSNELYSLIWEDDLNQGEDFESHGSESIRAVLDRVTSLIAQTDSRGVDQWIIFVSHGDVLQITQTWFRSIAGRLHRTDCSNNTLPRLSQFDTNISNLDLIIYIPLLILAIHHDARGQRSLKAILHYSKIMIRADQFCPPTLSSSNRPDSEN